MTATASRWTANKISNTTRISLDVFNLFNRKASDIDYFYSSQLAGEAGPVDDRHFHPVEPRSARVSITYEFWWRHRQQKK